MSDIECWDIFEIATDPDVTAEFHCGRRVLFAAAWAAPDGGRLRFMPDEEGAWSYRLSDGSTGEFRCTPPAAGNHGPVQRHGNTQWTYADGRRYVPIGTTCLEPAGRWSQTVSTLRDSAFNRVRMAAAGDPDRIENQVRDLLAADIQADIILFGPDAPPDDERIRQLVPRLAAFRNVWWTLAADEATVASRSTAQWERLAHLVEEYDHADHPLTIHAGDFAFAKPWLTHASVSLDNLRRVSVVAADFAKPILVDDCGWEGDEPDPRRSLTAADVVCRSWEGSVRGGHVTHGEAYASGWSAHGGELTGQSAGRLGFLRDILAEAPADATASRLHPDAPTLEAPGRYYLQFLGEHRFPSRTFAVPAGSYRVDVIDTWNRTIESTQETVTDKIGVILPGELYYAIRITRQD